MRRTTRLLLSVVAAATPVAGFVIPQTLTTTAVAAESSVDHVRLNGFEARLADDINSARRAHGMRALVVVPGATDVARRWSWHLAGAQTLSHNPALVRDLERSGSSAWTMVSENVGYGGASDPQGLFDAYMASPMHRANILDRSARYLGVGTVERDGYAWNTLDFVNAYSTRYGRTRVAADGLTMDRARITSTTDVAMLEVPDQRFMSLARGAVSASRVAFTGPSSGNDGGYTWLQRHHDGRGRGAVMMRDALDLSSAHSLSVQLSAANPRGRRVPVTILLRRSFGSAVVLGHATVGNRARWVTLSLPAAAKTFRNLIVVRMGSKALAAAGGKAKLTLYDVRAGV